MMKFYRVFRDGHEGVGEIYTNKELADTQARRMKRAFEERIRDTMARIGAPASFQDAYFIAFECDEQGNRAF